MQVTYLRLLQNDLPAMHFLPDTHDMWIKEPPLLPRLLVLEEAHALALDLSERGSGDAARPYWREEGGLAASLGLSAEHGEALGDQTVFVLSLHI